jgi:predicted lipid-binding transport protein (Tim44 family)
MSRIIAGRFDATLDADAALEALRREGFNRDEIDSFYVAPPGQNAMTPLGGDAPQASAGSRFAGFGAIAGALIGGLIGMLIGLAIDGRYGAVAVLFAAGVGAYVGSFLGTMGKVRGGRRAEASVEHPVEPKAGRLIAVNAERPGMEARALKVLRELGARDVGRADGTWRNGWKDFDPRLPLRRPDRLDAH